MNREVRKKMTAAKEEWTEERCKNAEKEMVSGNSKEAYNTPMALTKTQQRKSAVIEDSGENILTESTAVLNRWTSTAMAYTTTNSIQTLAYSRVARPPHERLKANLCRGKRPKRPCVRSLKAGKSPGVGNIPSELLKYGGEATTTAKVLIAICQILETKE